MIGFKKCHCTYTTTVLEEVERTFLILEILAAGVKASAELAPNDNKRIELNTFTMVALISCMAALFS